jgi:hypothetical protein
MAPYNNLIRSDAYDPPLAQGSSCLDAITWRASSGPRRANSQWQAILRIRNSDRTPPRPAARAGKSRYAASNADKNRSLPKRELLHPPGTPQFRNLPLVVNCNLTSLFVSVGDRRVP